MVVEQQEATPSAIASEGRSIAADDDEAAPSRATLELELGSLRMQLQEAAAKAAADLSEARCGPQDNKLTGCRLQLSMKHSPRYFVSVL